jgi:hypothetical protein
VHVELLRDSGGRESAAGSQTRSGLDGPEIESPGQRGFFVLVQTSPEAHPASCTMGTVSFPGVKRPGCSAEHENGLELYFYLPSVPAQACHD